MPGSLEQRVHAESEGHIGGMGMPGSRVPGELRVMLLGLAFVDDVGAIVVIAIFYSDGIHGGWLAAAAIGLLAVIALWRARVRYLPVYVVIGSGIWLATFESGIVVHPTD